MDFTPGQRITYRVRNYGEGDTRSGVVVRMTNDGRHLKVRADGSTYASTINVKSVVAQPVICTDCDAAFALQPEDFLRYDRHRDAWVTKAEEDGTILPQHGVCKPCQDAANEAHDEDRYGGPNHDLVEQRILEDERFVWDR